MKQRDVAFGGTGRGKHDAMNTDDIKGKLKETGGELTGDERLADEGRIDRAKGKVKDAAEDLGDAAEHVRDAVTRDEPRNP
jgi:uncharacterized protein YjbJ (UPF0337 family)